LNNGNSRTKKEFMPIAIKIENLSKQYRLGLISTRTLSHDMNRWVQMNIRGKEDPYLKIGENSGKGGSTIKDYIWALRDTNLEVEQGEVLGIIGKNGAGKSTLLKILSKVTAPTTGTVKARGRIASLLEVGTGFHPEMTGRENIYMNGAIMGMSKAEITRKLDEIVDFAGVETFIDTPVKRYSSGMTVRLGFAVAAHLEPEILVVDEVLAVGDAEFQKKAIGKMQDISKGEGRTVLFVSHNMASIINLCPRSLLLEDGKPAELGESEIVIAHYLQKEQVVKNDLRNIPRRGSKDLLITNFFTGYDKNRKDRSVVSGEKVTLNFEYEKEQENTLNNVSLGFSIHTQYGDVLSILYSDFTNEVFDIKKKRGAISCTIDKFPFSSGRYWIGLRVIRNGEELDYPDEKVGYIDVLNGDFYGTGHHNHSGLGPLLIRGKWSII